MVLKEINGLSFSTKSLEDVDTTDAQNGNILKYNSATKKWEASQTYVHIYASAGVNGTISPNGINNYQIGESVTYTFTPNYGYKIKNIFVDGLKIDSVEDTYTFTNLQKSSMIHVDFEESKWAVFTIHKDVSATSPETCVTYDSGAITSAAEAYQLVHDGWLCPSVVKEGQVNYFLYKPDLTKKATDETGLVSSGDASVLTGEDGDVCVSIKPIWWKVENNTDTELTFKISEEQFDGAFTANKFNGVVRKWLHVGMFDSTTEACTSIYSTTLKPKVNVTNNNFRSSTESRGETYNIVSHLTWQLWDILCVFTSGSLNSQVTIGKDYTNTSHSLTTAVSTSAMLTANGYTSSTKGDDNVSLMYLFLSNPWGNVIDWISGIKGVSNVVGVINDQSQARSISVDDAIPSTWTTFSNPSDFRGWIKDVQGATEYPFLIKETGGSSSIYFCDYGHLAASARYCAYVGGHYNNGDYAGAFGCNLNASSSTASAYFGARLQILDINPA